MLSIGKLVAGQAKYYLDQAEARVDVVDSVAEGLEDYYSERGGSRGEWTGRGAAALGLSGPVVGDDLRALLAGLRPGTGAELRVSSGRARVGAFDLTFSAPKSVSVLFGLGDPATRDAARRAHGIAVAQALEYVERTAIAVRRGHAGAIVERADGMVAAQFRHRTSRAGDPQLHTHALIANVARGPDGRWSALDGRQIYAHARAASLIYQAVLRSELSRTLGVKWTPVRDGIAEVAGIAQEVLELFSRRRLEIDAALAERGTSGPRASEAAALATRRHKQHGVDAGVLEREWWARASRCGLTPERLKGALARQSDRPLVPWTAIFDELLGPDGLTSRQPTFTRREVIAALCERLPAGCAVNARLLETAAERLLADDAVVPLIGDEDGLDEPDRWRGRNGARVPVAVQERRYSTAGHLAIEQRIVQRALTGRGTGRGIAPGEATAAVLARRPQLSDEQREMVGALTTDGDAVAVVVGSAGSGKTTALAAAHAAWAASGYPVRGVAVARRAARELQDGSSIPTTSVAAALSALEAGDPLPDRCVLVVDEAAQLATKHLAHLIGHVDRVGGKLVLVGDHHQLPELEAGGAFRGLVQRGVAVELAENRRQAEAWEREAVDQLRHGRADEALALYRRHDRLRIARTPEDARTRLVAEWWAAGDVSDSPMIAPRRSDVADLNRRARVHMRAAGRLGTVELDLPGGAFAAGDQVVIRLNDRARGVNNGDRGAIVAVDAGRCRIELDIDGRRVSLDAQFLHSRGWHGEDWLQQGYAITGHVAQGSTLGRAYVLASEGLSREWAYTALTRGREANYLYIAEEQDRERAEFAPSDPPEHRPTGIERTTRALETSVARPLALDTVPSPRHLDRELADVRRRLEDAQSRLTRVVEEREQLASRHATWLPARRRAVERAQAAEHRARRSLAGLERERATLEAQRRAVPPERPEPSPIALAPRRPQQREQDRGWELGR